MCVWCVVCGVRCVCGEDGVSLCTCCELKDDLGGLSCVGDDGLFGDFPLFG